MLTLICLQEREKYGQMVTKFQGQLAEYQMNLQMETEQRQKMQVSVTCFWIFLIRCSLNKPKQTSETFFITLTFLGKWSRPVYCQI